MSFQPYIGGQMEQTVQVLEDMIRACVMNFGFSGINTFHCVNFPTTIATTLVLIWLSFRPYLVGDIVLNREV